MESGTEIFRPRLFLFLAPLAIAIDLNAERGRAQEESSIISPYFEKPEGSSFRQHSSQHHQCSISVAVPAAPLEDLCSDPSFLRRSMLRKTNCFLALLAALPWGNSCSAATPSLLQSGHVASPFTRPSPHPRRTFGSVLAPVLPPPFIGVPP